MMQLDSRQREAVEYGDGPLLIVAGPGSGKTRVLVHRVAHMIAVRNIPAGKILLTTFTKKAAEEMRERLRGLIGNAADDLWLGTVHSRCLEVLRKGGPQKVGLPVNFTVCGDDVSRKMVEQITKGVAAEVVAREQNVRLDDVQAIDVTDAMNRHGLDAMHGRISFAKEWNLKPADMARHSWKRWAQEVYFRYNAELRKNGLADFGDLQMLTVEMLSKDPQVLKWIQDRFSYVLVDEYQDTNAIQAELFRLICREHRNLTVVGDADQCIPDGEMIPTPDGDRPVEQIRVGDQVLATRGRVQVPATVLRTSRSVHKRVLSFETETGRRFRCTPNHVVYASLTRASAGFYIYLMWSRGVGWRIGITKSGYLTQQWGRTTRANCEGAERMWFIDHAATQSEARYKETSLSLRYGIPAVTFVRRWNEQLVDEHRARIFQEFGQNGRRLLQDLGLSFDHPAYLAKANGSGLVAINVDQAGGRGTYVSIWSGKLPRSFQKRWHCAVAHKRGVRYGRLRALFQSYREAMAFARQLHSMLGEQRSYISQRLAVGRSPGSVRPINAAQLWPGMMVVATSPDGRVTRDQIKTRTEEHGRFTCRDLEVENLANYFVGGVCVHNSIYAFRGATPSFMLDFAKEWYGAKRIDLDCNYRSTGSIVDVSRSVIVNNAGRFDMEPRTDNQPGAAPVMIRVMDQESEADWLAKQVRLLHDRYGVPFSEMAVLYRTHRQSRLPERAFRLLKLPFEILGGMPFFERREVKDLLAWLALLINPQDRESFRRAMFAPPRGVGDITLKRVYDHAEVMSPRNLIELARNGMMPGMLAKQRKALRVFGETAAEFLNAIQSENLLVRIAEETGYRKFLNTQEDGVARLENVDELCALYSEFDPPPGMEQERPKAFLDWAATELQRTEARDLERGKSVMMMTMHAAKGTEFNTVFVIGCMDGVIPSFRADDDDQVEEERRLFYVAMTRAKERLYMLAPSLRLTATGERLPTTPSPFLFEAEEGGAKWAR